MFRKNSAIFVVCFSVVAMMSVPVGAISEGQEAAITERCEVIRDDLRNLQHSDSKTRVYLGRYYETILAKFIMPLNVRLVENNLSNSDLIDNQSNFTKARTSFMADFVEYQKRLENLVAMDCRNEPSRFYDALTKARAWRETVANDVVRLNKLAVEQANLVTKLKEKM